MSTHKHIDRICCAALALVLILTIVFANAQKLGITQTEREIGYESRLFDTSYVHTIDLVMDDWDSFIESCENEEYAACTAVIDGEAYSNIGIRAKGNTSLSSVAAYGNDRYSFKLEFDQYDDSKSYYGLDKISLNNIIQDNTYMKDYLTYQLMGEFGVSAPLCSYVYITVNGEDWGLYLAVESVEESFLERNYGSDYGELYKPDSMSMGGGRGNGREFQADEDSSETEEKAAQPAFNNRAEAPQITKNSTSEQADSEMSGKQPTLGGRGGMGSDDVALIYSDDDPDSYSNIFDNAKTDVSDADQERLLASLKQLNEGTDIEAVVDIEQVIRYFVVHNFVCNFDSYTGSMMHNYYLYEEDGVLSMIPWDYNLAFGGFGSSDAESLVNYPIDSPVSGGDTDSRPMLAWIFADETYTALYHQYFAELIETYFDSGVVESVIEEVKTMIAPYVEKDPTKFCTTEEFETGIETLKQFCTLRAESVSGQLEGTIPSTSEGQDADSSALIDASSVTVSAMGSQGMGNGGMRDVFGTQTMPQTSEEPSETTQDGEDSAETDQNSSMPTEPPQMTGGESEMNGAMGDAPPTASDGGRQPFGNADQDSSAMSGRAKLSAEAGGSPDEPQGAAGNSQWPLLGATIVILLAGIAIAFRFKR
ncbi:MAG: CotH kinase family protein [Butyricicoccaceae bacterium]